MFAVTVGDAPPLKKLAPRIEPETLELRLIKVDASAPQEFHRVLLSRLPEGEPVEHAVVLQAAVAAVVVTVIGHVPGLSPDEFRSAADDAKVNFAVSKALTGTTVTLAD